MAIGVCGRIQRKCINEDLLEKVLTKCFVSEGGFIREINEKCVLYKHVCNDDSVIITFINEKKPPYNIYDSNIINDGFEYKQLKLFDIKKELASVDIYKEIINFCICLKKEIESDILITSDVHDDICLLKGKEIIWSQYLSIYTRSRWVK